MKKVNLFCLPFAGGNKYSYRGYEEKAPSFINFIALEYPGRGSRIREKLVGDVNALVTDMFQQIRERIDEGEYAIYGHSLGGLIACLLVRKIVLSGLKPPMHIFITGTTGPSASSRDSMQRHLLSKEDLIGELRKLNGCPEEILQDKDMWEYFEPILRADFKASETFEYQDSEPLDIPFTVVTGTDEDMEMEDIRTWQRESVYTVQFERLPGNHFFIFNCSSEMINIISRDLAKHIKSISYEYYKEIPSTKCSD